MTDSMQHSNMRKACQEEKAKEGFTAEGAEDAEETENWNHG
jgi:hypothetical protein